jgi:hypothetical protein
LTLLTVAQLFLQQFQNYSNRKRLRYHKHHSSKHIKNIYAKIIRLFDNKLIEPNSESDKATLPECAKKSGANHAIRHDYEMISKGELR